MKIIKYPAPSLRRPAQEVPAELIGSRELVEQALEVRMALLKQHGYALTHNQVYDPGLRMFVLNSELVGFRPEEEAVVNPTIAPAADEGEETDVEGCLSIPGIQIPVARWKAVDARWVDTLGNKYERRLTGVAARVFQHEVDHLDGRLIIDSVPIAKRAKLRAQSLKFRKGGR